MIRWNNTISLSAVAFAMAVLGVPFSGGSLSLMYYYPIVLIVIGLTFLSILKEKTHLILEHLAVVILLLVTIWHIDTSIDHFERSKTVISILLFLSMFFLLTMHIPSLKEIKMVSRCFAYSGVIIAILMLLFKQEYVMGRYSYSIMGRLLEVNYLACYLSITFLFNFHQMLISKQVKRLKYIIFSFMVLYAIFLTGSRGAFLAVIISSFLLLMYNPQRIILKIFVLFLLFFLGFLILPDDLTSRFINNSYNDGSNRMRLYLFRNALSFIIDKPILGYGITSGQVITEFDSAHNTFLSVLLNFGLVGLLMFFIIMFRNFKMFLQKDMLLFLAIFVDLFFTSMIITNYNTIPFWFTMIFLVWIKEFKRNHPNEILWEKI